MKAGKLLLLSLCLCGSASLAAFAGEPKAAAPSQKAATPSLKVTAAQMAEILGTVAAPASGAPAPVYKSDCTATNTSCPDGCPISCTGTSSCSVGTNSVTCDGVTTGCLFPSCTPGPNCSSPGQKCDFCTCRHYGGTIPQCACLLN